MTTHHERIYTTYGKKPLGMNLLKVSAKLLTYAICFEDGNVNSYNPPEAQPETV